jgi:acetyltransferase-like isoleucine patch superfamily enzyme
MGFFTLQKWWKNKKNKLYTFAVKTDFGSIGKNSRICPPFHSGNVKNIYIGNDSSVMAGGWLECVPEYRGIKYDPRIDVGNGTYIGHHAHIIACSQMKIGNNVVIADNVYISDCLHGFEDVSMPILEQPLVNLGRVIIEDEAWLGERVCVLPNVTIGKHSVIGANSVVTKDIPAYCVAVGTPAKVIKKYDFNTKKWVRI